MVVERVEMKMWKFEGLMGQRASRSPHVVHESCAPPRAVMLDVRIDGDDAQAGPSVRACTSTLVNTRPPRLMCADMGLLVDDNLVRRDGASRIWVGEVRRAAVRLSDWHLALMCAR